MKIAFLHTRNFFTSEILRHFRTALAHHEVVEWLEGNDAPAFDFDVLLAMSHVGRELLLVQPKLMLVQTASDGYENVDIDAASKLGIWVSYARPTLRATQLLLRSSRFCFCSAQHDILGGLDFLHGGLSRRQRLVSHSGGRRCALLAWGPSGNSS